MVPRPESVPAKAARIVFMGTPSFAAIVLEGLLEDGWNVVGAVTQPDKPRGRGRRMSAPPVSQVARKRGILVLQPRDVRDPIFHDDLRDLRPDIMVVAAYGKLLPGEILHLPPLGCFNVHASLLPAYRGAAPIRWSIMNGERETGITLFRMEAGMDTGDMVAAASLPIDPDVTAGELAEQLAELTLGILPGALHDIIEGRARFVPQDHDKATFAPVLRKEDGRIDWTLDATAIRNRVRGLDPWPGAFTFWRGKRLRLWEADRVEDGSGVTPGEVLSVSGEGLRVATGDGVLRVDSVQLEGRRRMRVAEFIRGHRMEPGERLG